MFRLRESIQSDAVSLAPKLRDIDKLECECVGSTAEISLLSPFTLPDSVVLSGINEDEEVILMCGISKCPVTPEMGVIWMLASPKIYNHRREIIKLSKPTIAKLSEGYKAVYNMIHKDNKLSIRWLEWCGFIVDKTRIYVKGGEDFYLLLKET